MINIKREIVNKVTLTLTELSTLDNPYYILELYSNENRSTKFVYLGTDKSPNKIRYNLFKLEETELEDLIDSKVSLPSESYDYKVWESETLTLVVDSFKGVVESGKLIVSSEVDDKEYINNKTEYTYNGKQ